MTASDELARYPDRPVLLLDLPGDVAEEQRAAASLAAATAYGSGMIVLGFHLAATAPAAFQGRDVVVWPWRCLPQQRDALTAALVRLQGHVKRLRVISPAAVDDYLGPHDLNGHEPIGWARERAIEFKPPTDTCQAPVAEPDLVDVWELDDRYEKDTTPLVSDYVPHPDMLEGDARETERGFRFRSAAELIAEPVPTDWLVQGWFERNTLAMYFGDPSSCKTWIALSQAVHVAMGVPWFGAKVQQGAVFILCGEGHRGFRRRLEGIRKYHEMSYDHVPLYVSEGPAALTEEESVVQVQRAIEALADSTGYAPSLIVIDTLARNFGASDENSTPDMTAFVGALDRIRTAYGCTILVVHHSGLADKSRGRGNSSLRAALDAEFRFARSEDGGIDASCTKAKDFEAPEPRRFELVNVPLDWPAGDDGLPVSSAAVRPVDSPLEDAREAMVPRGTSGAASPLGANQQKALEVLEAEYVKCARRLKDQGRDPFSARVSLAMWREASGLDRRRFSEVLNTLESRGKVRRDGADVLLCN